jgi:hypothetical protein
VGVRKKVWPEHASHLRCSRTLAFCTSSFKHRLERQGFLAPELYLFGDIAYIKTSYMATPFKGVASDKKE